MRAARFCLLLGLSLLAGCLGFWNDDEEAEVASPAGAGEDARAGGGSRAGTGSGPGHSSDARPAPAFGPAVNVSKERAGSEPMLGVGPDGALYVAGTGPGSDLVVASGPQQGVWRSLDDGVSWEEVTPELPTAGGGGLDNALAVDGDGRVYYLNAVGETPHLFGSDDRGETWVPLTPPAPPAVVHRTWLEPVEGTLHFVGLETPPSNNIYYLGSDDRARTWGPPGLVDVSPYTASELAVAAGGEDLYLVTQPNTYGLEEDGWRLAASHDGGLTWEHVPMWTLGREPTMAFMPLEVAPDGTLFLAWTEQRAGTSLLVYAHSSDEGETWSDPVPVGDVSGSQALAWMDVRDDGELGLVYYANNDTGAPMDVEGAWYAEYTFVQDADTPDPSTARTRLTGWPVHEGPVCPGVVCPGKTRALLDFAWIEFGPDDRAHTVFASSRWDGPSAFPVYAGEAEAYPPGS